MRRRRRRGGGTPWPARVARRRARPRRRSPSLLKLDGLLGCALVDAVSGLVLAHETRDPESLDMELAAAACAQVLGTHRDAARNMGLAIRSTK